MDRYLHLRTRPPASPRRGRPRRVPAISVPSLLGLLGLLVSAGMAAAALGRLVAAIPDGVAQQPAAAGCLDAPVEALAASRVAGRATLCLLDGSIPWTLQIEQLAGRASYAGWLATFDHPDQCRFGALAHYVPGFRQPCALDDLTGPQPLARLEQVGDARADAAGGLHLEGVVRDAHLPAHAQVWLLAGPAPPIQSAPAAPAWVARAVFDLP